MVESLKNISVQTLKTKLETNEIVLIDVREPVEHRTERIGGDILVPLGEISVDRLPTREKPLILYCRSGQRSLAACKKLLSEDASLELYSLEGGIVAWKNAGFHIERADANVFP